MFKHYSYYSSILRNWFIVYGIGGLIFIANQRELFNGLEKTEKSMVLGFLMWGVIIQICLALLNKIIHWFVYWSEDIEPEKKRLNLFGHIYNALYIASEKICSWFWIDIIIDITTLILFFVATRSLLQFI